MKNKLYNLIFPLWVGMFFPPLVFLVLVGNLIVDGLIIYLSLRLNNVKLQWKKLSLLILKAWGIGFASDITGAFLLFLISIGTGSVDQYNPWRSIFSVTIYSGVILLVGILIYILNYGLLLKAGVEENVSKKVAIAMGLITAPWMFLFPANWFF